MSTAAKMLREVADNLREAAEALEDTEEGAAVPQDAKCESCRWWELNSMCYIHPEAVSRDSTDPACRHYEEKP